VSSDDRFSFLLTVLVGAAVILGASHMARPPAAGIPDPPRVGVAPDRVVVGPAFPLDDAPATAPLAQVSEGERRVLEALRGVSWPEFARTVVFHPLAAAAADAGDLEQGPPFHAVVDVDGAVRFTPRGLSAGRALPPGIPADHALAALHVAIPDAARATPERMEAVRVLWREATRRLGDGAAMFADEVPGSTVRLPEGFDRAPWVAPQQTRPGATRPASAATRPAGDRVRIRFGGATVDAGVAATATTRYEGLMGRTSLRKDEGLLFVYRQEEQRSFWMKNCLIALDILYLRDDGEVVEVRTMQPPDPKLPDANLPRFVSPSPIRLVLEVEAGYARAHGVGKGSRLGLPANLPQLVAKAEP
jgi:uncharacterized membrane protein (UPF0127 family)